MPANTNVNEEKYYYRGVFGTHTHTTTHTHIFKVSYQH
jgi:hypothetical protein